MIFVEETEKSSPTKPEELDLYKKEVERWIEKLGLKEWENYLRYKKGGEISVYKIAPDLESMSATFILPTKMWDDGDREEDIKRSALHEVLELLLAPLWLPLLNVYREKDKHYRGEIHKIIHRLSKLLEEKKE